MVSNTTKTSIVERAPKVAVVGAGPAGCAAACALGQAKFNAFVFERGQPGKDKPCGDAFVPSAIELLSHYGIDQDCIASLGGYPFQRIDLYGHDSLIWQLKLSPGTGWVIPRAILDQKLRDVTAAYATIQYETSVTDLIIEQGGSLKLSLRQNGSTDEFQCDAVILASGSRSPFTKKWGISGQPIMTASVTGYAAREVHEAPIFQFKEAYRPGYGWLFPMSGGLVNIGVCALSPYNAKHLRQLVAHFSTEWGVSQCRRWRGGGGPLWSGKGHTWHHRAGIISCGDAAGLVDPFTGEGITAALISGEHAGTAVSMYLRENRHPARLEEYSHWVKEHFSRKYRKTYLRRVWGELCGI